MPYVPTLEEQRQAEQEQKALPPSLLESLGVGSEEAVIIDVRRQELAQAEHEARERAKAEAERVKTGGANEN